MVLVGRIICGATVGSVKGSDFWRIFQRSPQFFFFLNIRSPQFPTLVTEKCCSKSVQLMCRVSRVLNLPSSSCYDRWHVNLTFSFFSHLLVNDCLNMLIKLRFTSSVSKNIFFRFYFYSKKMIFFYNLKYFWKVLVVWIN